MYQSSQSSPRVTRRTHVVDRRTDSLSTMIFARFAAVCNGKKTTVRCRIQLIKLVAATMVVCTEGRVVDGSSPRAGVDYHSFHC